MLCFFYHLLLYREEKWLRHVSMVAVSLYLNCGPGNMAEKKLACTVEPRYNERLYNEVLAITNDIFRPSNGYVYEKEPRYKKTLL